MKFFFSHGFGLQVYGWNAENLIFNKIHILVAKQPLSKILTILVLNEKYWSQFSEKLFWNGPWQAFRVDFGYRNFKQDKLIDVYKLLRFFSQSVVNWKGFHLKNSPNPLKCLFREINHENTTFGPFSTHFNHSGSKN